MSVSPQEHSQVFRLHNKNKDFIIRLQIESKIEQ